MITREQRRQAEFYATLGSISRLEDLSAAERIRLARQFDAASSMRIRNGFGGVTGSDFHYNGTFRGLHSFVRSTLSSLLAHEHIEVREIGLPPPTWHLERKRRELVLVQTWDVTSPKAKPATEFAALLHLHPFPFARCPVCQNFFVRAGRRLYCSHECATRGVEAARKDQKREYMREYMAKLRAKQRRNPR
jgi:hypothetical protein